MPLTEELYFRGLILQKLNIKFSTFIAIILTAILFTFPHTRNQLIPIFIFSVLISIFFLKFRNIWLIVIIHGFSNFIDWLYFGYGGIRYIESRTVEEISLISTWAPEIIIAVFFYLICVYLLSNNPLINRIQSDQHGKFT